jgi:hypothetical protein
MESLYFAANFPCYWPEKEKEKGGKEKEKEGERRGKEKEKEEKGIEKGRGTLILTLTQQS